MTPLFVKTYENVRIRESNDFLRTKSKTVRKNPASPDTPTDKSVAWSNTIIDFSIKINNLYVLD